MQAWEPVYLETHRRGLLQAKIDAAYEILSQCNLCPRNCLVDRHHGELGLCRTGDQPVVSSYGPHFGEEDPLVGSHGSGTIFFTHCNLYCLFCQNYEISHGGEGEEISVEDLAAMMLVLQKRGCHNINFVTPSHQVYQILAALPAAIAGGLNVPLVYNTGGYDALETLRLLDGVVDIYMPDFKFWDPQVAKDLCQAEDYPEIARQAVKEMHRQVGDLAVDDQGVARRGLLVRHLVLPDGLAGTKGDHGISWPGRSRPGPTSTSWANIVPAAGPRSTRPYENSSRPWSTNRPSNMAREAGLTRLDRREKLFRWL